MKIFQKTHFWKDRRTFLDVDADLPKLNERGYAEDGSATIRIGDEGGIKAAFKMGADEVRALRDVLDHFIRLNDRNMMKLFKQGRERRSERRSESREPPVETVEVEPAQFSIFDKEEDKREEPKTRYYY